MLDYLPGDSRHIGCLTCEYICVCLEEGNKLIFLFLVESNPNANDLGGLSRVERYLLDMVIRLWCNLRLLWHLTSLSIDMNNEHLLVLLDWEVLVAASLRLLIIFGSSTSGVNLRSTRGV